MADLPVVNISGAHEVEQANVKFVELFLYTPDGNTLSTTAWTLVLKRDTHRKVTLCRVSFEILYDFFVGHVAANGWLNLSLQSQPPLGSFDSSKPIIVDIELNSSLLPVLDQIEGDVWAVAAVLSREVVPPPLVASDIDPLVESENWSTTVVRQVIDDQTSVGYATPWAVLHP